MAGRSVGPTSGLEVSNGDTGMTYLLGEELGEGGFGQTFECTDRFDEKLVAKVLKPRGTGRAAVKAEWQAEVDHLMTLRHPYITHIFDAFVFGGRHYLILERASGAVSELIPIAKRWTVAEREQFVVGTLARQLLSALHFVHANNVVHRDVHIDNVLFLVTDQTFTIKLADFGISKTVGEDSGRAYTAIGREYDVAPELHARGYTTAQSDVYQVGLILYHVLTGRPALRDTDGDAAEAILSGVARERAENLKSRLGGPIATMLRRTESYRFASALDAWEALRDCM